MDGRNVKHQVSTGMLVAAAVLSLPGVSSLAKGDLGRSAGLLVIPVVLAAVGLSLRVSTPWVPLVVGGVIATALVAVTIASSDEGPDTVNAAPSPIPPPLAGTPPTAPRPVLGETDWLPSRDKISATDQSAYDSYVELFAAYEQASKKADQAQSDFRQGVKDNAAMKRRYQQGQVSYSALMHSYDQMQTKRDVVATTMETAVDLGARVVESRMAAGELFG